MTRRLRKIADYFTATGFVLVVILAAAYFGRLGETEHRGSFQIIDGDSLRLGSQEFRLEGIDAPEYRQKCRQNDREWDCGRQSANSLRALMRSSTVLCRGLGVDKFERVLVRCKDGDLDVNASMVAEGWAVSFGDYQHEESLARAEKRGIWAGEFQRPRQWRDERQDVYGDTVAEADQGGLFSGFFAWLRLWWQGFSIQ